MMHTQSYARREKITDPSQEGMDYPLKYACPLRGPNTR